jgi:hypothetical protein
MDENFFVDVFQLIQLARFLNEGDQIRRQFDGDVAIFGRNLALNFLADSWKHGLNLTSCLSGVFELSGDFGRRVREEEVGLKFALLNLILKNVNHFVWLWQFLAEVEFERIVAAPHHKMPNISLT